MIAFDNSSCVVFGDWRFDRRQGGLFRREASGTWVPVGLGARAQDILAVLLQDPGSLCSKDVLMNAAWPDIAVEVNNLTVQIAALRGVLDQAGGEESCIQTVPGRGYRFVGQVVPRET
jgi:DNA-binding winged helix-turn-helix (wHTH) protein